MNFGSGPSLLDSLVLSLLAKEDSYGYKITQDIREILDISESTLYPILRRLQKENCLETYDEAFSGRNRRYYKITSNGMIVLDNLRREWITYRKKIDKILLALED